MAGKVTGEQIVEAADRLFYERGYEHTSFSDIAGAVGISRGNFYYHFKTKDEILDAVIARRRGATGEMLARWDAEGGDPAARIRCFVRILVTNRAKIMLYGCPVGTLVSELAKLDHAAQEDAGAIFGQFRAWLARQFAELGRADDADGLAMQLLSQSQGAATMATAFRDEAFLRAEVERMCAWVDQQVAAGAPA